MTHRKFALVTGGAGFIGSNICDKLLASGYHVTCVDNYISSSTNNIAHLTNNTNFQVIDHDITLPLHDLDINPNIEEIYNFACPASPSRYQKYPIETTKTNVYGAINMLEFAKITNATIIQASTSEVYGIPYSHPQKETHWGHVNPIGIRACYDEGKRCAESIFFDYFRQFNVKIKIIRIFNTYGPGMSINDGRVIPNIITQALQGNPITIYGNGNQTRSFCFIDDLTKAIYAISNTKYDVTGPINIGSIDECRIIDLVKMVVDITGSRSSIVNLELPEDDPPRRKPNIKLANRLLNWKPTTKLYEGLTKTVEYFQNNQDKKI